MGPQVKKRSRPTIAQVGPHKVDVHVGGRVRLARLLADRTQQWLADKVKLTFQQIQKYERGANRISCSMLAEFASVLDRPVSWFFEELPGESWDESLDPEMAARQTMTDELAGEFAKVKSEQSRKQIVALVRALAVDEQGKTRKRPSR